MPALCVTVSYNILGNDEFEENLHGKEIESWELGECSNNCVKEIDDVLMLAVVVEAFHIECGGAGSMFRELKSKSQNTNLVDC